VLKQVRMCRETREQLAREGFGPPLVRGPVAPPSIIEPQNAPDRPVVIEEQVEVETRTTTRTTTRITPLP
jgi:hypothetical protein